MNKIMLESSRNGLIITHKTDSLYEEDVTITNKYVFEEKSDNYPPTRGLPEQRALQECFWFIKEALEVFYSKHNKTRLDIVIIDQETGEEIEFD